MTWLFDTAHFLTRDHCGLTGTLKNVYLVANLVTAVAYFAIPAMLLRIYRSKRQDLPSPWTLALFASFIVLCGATHLSDIAVFWWPAYRLYTGVFVLTAIASGATAMAVPKAVRVIIRMPSRHHVHELNDKLQHAVSMLDLELAERTKERDALLNELNAARDVVSSQSWISDRSAVLESLNKATRILVEN